MKAIWPREEALRINRDTPDNPKILRHLSNNLCLVQVPRPRPQAGEVLIQVHAAGINRADLLQAAGHYPPPPGASRALGLECSGTVVEVGDNHDNALLGQAVCALLDGGGYAEFVAVPTELLLPLPLPNKSLQSGATSGSFPNSPDNPQIAEDVTSPQDKTPDTSVLTDTTIAPSARDFAAAAALPEAAATAWSNLVMVGGLQEGQRVLIHGASGGVGSLAVQIASHLGAQVFATAGNTQRCKQVAELGAKRVFDYHTLTPADTKQATGGYGFDLILDVTGAGGLESNLKMLATGGKLVIIGLQKGTRAELNLGLVLNRRAQIIGTTLRSRPLPEKAAIISQVRRYLWPQVQSGIIRPVYRALDNFEVVATETPEDGNQTETPSSPLELTALAHHELGRKTERPFGKLVLSLG